MYHHIIYINIMVKVEMGKVEVQYLNIILSPRYTKYLHTKSNKKIEFVYILYTSFMLLLCNSIYTSLFRLLKFT